MVNTQDVMGLVKNNIGTIGAGVGGLIVGGTVGYIAGRKSAVSSKSARKRSSNRKRRSTARTKSRVGKRKRYTPHTAGKGKDTSHKRIRHTKNGQPYIIMASGKARFIKKSSARRSRKTKGGRY